MTNSFFDKSDDTLVELTLLGHTQAYEELVIRHEKSVKGTAYKVTENRFSADDASQDAFVSAWMHLASLKEPAKFGSWVCSIAKNSAINLIRHYRNTIPDISLDLVEYRDLTDNCDDLMDWETKAELHDAVDALSEKIRLVVQLHYFEDLSVKEIAKKLNLSEGTVKWRLSEGRKQLRKGYGMTENMYNEEESMVKRVMRQVEELKLWQLRGSKSGFREEYHRVLAAVEALEDSDEKSHALADVYQLAYWWLEDENKEELFRQIKEHALRGHNDDVMQLVMCEEHDHLEGKQKIDCMLQQQIPFLKEHQFPCSLAYVWFWLGHAYLSSGSYAEAMEAFQYCYETAPENDVYHALSKAAMFSEQAVDAAKKEPGVEIAGADPTGEGYRIIDGKLYFWTQPGYDGTEEHDYDALFYNLSRCDSLMMDPDMKVGEKRISSNGNSTLYYRENDAVIDTPAGHFDGVSVFVTEVNRSQRRVYTTWICPGVGIVAQRTDNKQKTYHWQLAKYTVTGDGMLPMNPGNRWEYTFLHEQKNEMEDTGKKQKKFHMYEVDYNDGETVNLAHYGYTLQYGYLDTWEGQTLAYRERYCHEVASHDWALDDIFPFLNRAAELAETKRQKVHTRIAADVMHRIFDTDLIWTPDCREVNRWNFFDIYDVERKNGTICLYGTSEYTFEWKDMSHCGVEGSKVLYNFLYDIFAESVGCMWSDEWADGYRIDEMIIEDYDTIITRNFCVQAEKTVETPVGIFEDCLKVSYEVSGPSGGFGYRAGYFEYWFAPGVGIVKFQHPVGDGVENIWHLTSYQGRGEGYFPINDGLVRRYEPKALGDGWRASVEYTFDEDTSGLVLFRNAVGVQARENYDKAVGK